MTPLGLVSNSTSNRGAISYGLFAACCLAWFPLLIVAMSENFRPVSPSRHFAQLAAQIVYFGTWIGAFFWTLNRTRGGQRRVPLHSAAAAFALLLVLFPTFGPIYFLFASRIFGPKSDSP